MFGNNKMPPAAILAAGLVALAALGCGGEQSVASKSAAAFREAQKTGEPLGGAEHGHGAMTPGGGHEMPDAAPGASAGSHAEMAEEGVEGMAGMDHTGMAHGGKESMAGMDHSQMPQGSKEGMAGMDHSQMPQGSKEGMAGMDHSTGGAGGLPPATTPSSPAPPSPGQPAKTLQSDALDAPASTSVLDAQRSAEMAQGMTGGHGGHGGGHGVGRYRQVDAGRGPGAYPGSDAQPTGTDPHQQHGTAAPEPPQQEGENSHEPPAGPGASENAAAVYTCPMHPEVTSKTPGKCPKCGMTLVQRRNG